VKPIARIKDLVVETVDDGLFVVDLEKDSAHLLKRPTAFVWQHCDGKHSVDELSDLLGTMLGVEAAPEVVRLSLDMLGKARLLEADTAVATTQSLVSRRKMLRAASIVSAALMTSLSLPSAARAQSGE
jgi:hypothetical protein